MVSRLCTTVLAVPGARPKILMAPILLASAANASSPSPTDVPQCHSVLPCLRVLRKPYLARRSRTPGSKRSPLRSQKSSSSSIPRAVCTFARTRSTFLPTSCFNVIVIVQSHLLPRVLLPYLLAFAEYSCSFKVFFQRDAQRLFPAIPSPASPSLVTPAPQRARRPQQPI